MAVHDDRTGPGGELAQYRPDGAGIARPVHQALALFGPPKLSSGPCQSATPGRPARLSAITRPGSSPGSARAAALGYIRDAREVGHSWDQIGQALGMIPGGDAGQQGATIGEAAYTYAAGRPDTEAPWQPRSFTWHCRSCDQAISDRGLIAGPAGDEQGHTEHCPRLTERAESEARLADARTASAATADDLIIQQADAGTTPECIEDSQDEIATWLLSDASTPEGQAYARAFSDTAAAYVRELRQRDPLPEPDRAPGAPHPNPFLASRGWHVNEHGIYSRRPEPQAAPQPEKDLEAG